MPSLHHKLSILSRDRTFLIRATFTVLAIFFLAGLLTAKTMGGQSWLITTSIILTGLVWFLIITKICGVDRIRDIRIVFSLIALILGVLSAMATLTVIEWQRKVGGLQMNGEIINDIIYCICDIGLREEIVKIVFVIPLIPFVLRRRDESEMLLVSSCVGLGFAVFENTLYFNGVGGDWGRMLTANFFHIAMTGALGLALFRFIRWPKSRWEGFIGTFIVVVLLHGIYDALIMVYIFEEQQLIWFILFCVIAHKYFDLVFETRGNVQQRISPLGVFVLGSAVLIGIAWIAVCSTMDWHSALQSAGTGTLSTATLAFLYINRLRSE